MHRPPRRKKRSPVIPQTQPPTATTLSRADRIRIVAFVAAVFAIFGGTTWYHVVKVGRYDMDENVNYCRTQYRLGEDQTARLRALELDFHGRNKRFGFFTPEGGTSPEHHLAISRLMEPGDGARFLAAEAGRVR